ncbi:MAG: GDSL-type esterase/lipase family protein [Chlamydiota bacterium]|nr:GDSL-type esterase/lipase family protein [Chlamydiota bacterium]
MKLTGLIIFGDSVLAGTGASDRDCGCAKLVKNGLRIPVSLRARNWNTSRDGLERLDDDVIKQTQFSHVLILFGNNDSWLSGPGQSKVPLEEFRKNLQEIISRIRNKKQFPLLCNLQLINQEAFIKRFPELDEYRKVIKLTANQIHQQYNDAIEKIAKEAEVGLIDIRSKLNLSAEECVAEDGIHPNDAGHRIIADVILQYLQQLDKGLEIPSATKQDQVK